MAVPVKRGSQKNRYLRAALGGGWRRPSTRSISEVTGTTSGTIVAEFVFATPTASCTYENRGEVPEWLKAMVC